MQILAEIALVVILAGLALMTIAVGLLMLYDAVTEIWDGPWWSIRERRANKRLEREAALHKRPRRDLRDRRGPE